MSFGGPLSSGRSKTEDAPGFQQGIKWILIGLCVTSWVAVVCMGPSLTSVRATSIPFPVSRDLNEPKKLRRCHHE